jgi:hypothetical protein
MIQNNFQNPANNERRHVLNLSGNLTWRLAIDLMVSIDREVIQNKPSPIMHHIFMGAKRHTRRWWRRERGRERKSRNTW